MMKGLTGNKFNARAVRSFEYLEARAKRLEGIIAQLKESGAKTIDVNLSPRGPRGEMGPPGLSSHTTEHPFLPQKHTQRRPVLLARTRPVIILFT